MEIVFERNGQQKTATTPAEAVGLRFDGWHEVRSAATPAAPPQRLVPPPRSGSGSGHEHWAEYATLAGITVPDDATREEIIEALAAAGVPTDVEEEH